MTCFCIAGSPNLDICIWDAMLHWPSISFLYDDTTLTKHQAFAPSGPILLSSKFRKVRVKFCRRAGAKAWQETRDLRNTMKRKPVAPEWYTALLLCRLCCIMCSRSPNSCHDKTLSNWVKRTSSNSLRFGSHLDHERGTSSVISQMSLPNGCVLILPFFTSPPFTTTSLPNTKPLPLQGRCCWIAKPGSSGWSSAAWPRPQPSRRQMIWERRNIAQTCKNLMIVFLLSKLKLLGSRKTHETTKSLWVINEHIAIFALLICYALPYEVTAWQASKSGPDCTNLTPHLLWETLNLTFDDLEHVNVKKMQLTCAVVL